MIYVLKNFSDTFTKMKILLFDNSALLYTKNDYHIERGTGEFSQELKSLGNDVVFYGQVIPSFATTTDIYPLLANGLKVVGSPKYKVKLLTYFLLYLRAIPQILKSDFIYMFYPNSLRFLLFFAFIFNKKFGLYIRGIDDLKKIESNFFYKRAFKIFTVADYFTDYVNQISPQKVASTIRPMIIFDETDITNSLEYRGNRETLKVLYLGRMSNDKGVIELLRATKFILDQKINIEVDLVGSGEYLGELQALAIDLGVTNNVSFRGAVFDKKIIRKYYEDADLYILPTYHEGFPRTLYEAMIFGTPIITTFVGGISGLMKNNVNCIEIQPKSVDSAARGLIYARNNYDKMLNLADNARNTIKTIFSERKKSHAQCLNESLINLKL